MERGYCWHQEIKRWRHFETAPPSGRFWHYFIVIQSNRGQNLDMTQERRHRSGTCLASAETANRNRSIIRSHQFRSTIKNPLKHYLTMHCQYFWAVYVCDWFCSTAVVVTALLTRDSGSAISRCGLNTIIYRLSRSWCSQMIQPQSAIFV